MIHNRKKLDIKYYTAEDINNNKCTLEKLKRLNPKLNDSNPLTYMIYLKSRPDLPNDERMHYEQLQNKLMDMERQLVANALMTFELHEN